ncbi:MAG TPA: glycosyltransferase family 2 protein [Capsulimonadaceae bacterium]|jgi:hypothetical protein
MTPDVHISIVSYNTAELLDNCLTALESHESVATFTVTVIDNGSRDGTVDMVRSRHPNVAVIESGANLGYGRANNFALLNSDARYYLILNSDTIVHDGALDAMVEALDTHPEYGAVGGALLNPDGSPQTTWAAGKLDLAAVLLEQTYLAKLFPRSRRFGAYFEGWADRTKDAAIEQSCGACMMVRADLFNQLGGFDPRIFMYAEDTDLSKRIRDRGLGIAYVASARVTHHHGQSSGGAIRPRMIFEHNRSRIYYFLKHESPAVATTARAIMVAGALLRGLLWLGASVTGRRGALANASSFFVVAAQTALVRVSVPRRKGGEQCA